MKKQSIYDLVLECSLPSPPSISFNSDPIFSLSLQSIVITEASLLCLEKAKQIAFTFPVLGNFAPHSHVAHSPFLSFIRETSLITLLTSPLPQQDQFTEPCFPLSSLNCFDFLCNTYPLALYILFVLYTVTFLLPAC